MPEARAFRRAGRGKSAPPVRRGESGSRLARPPLSYSTGSEAFGAATVREREGDLVKLHFFISRAGEDREWAKWIANMLEAEGHTTTPQALDFTPRASILHQMKLAEDRANHFIAVLSPHYLDRKSTRLNSS